MNIKELYQEIIIDHGTNPRNNFKIKNYNYNKTGFNPLCGDTIDLYLFIENNNIKDISFQGQGCSISIASVSIMTEIIKNKTIKEALNIFNIFNHIIKNKKYNKSEIDNLYKLKALGNVKKFPTRIKCATLAWHTLKIIIKK